MCYQGYFCSGGATNGEQHDCPEGYKCTTGSPSPTPCPAGYYQNERKKWTCKPCPAGFYCNDTHGPVVNYALTECIEGHFCPESTKYATQHKCPPGTFNNRTGMDDLGDCLSCTGRHVCDEYGLARPNRVCSAGYFCREGANMTTPNLGEKADICPRGYYCPEGAFCWNDSTGCHGGD